MLRYHHIISFQRLRRSAFRFRRSERDDMCTHGMGQFNAHMSQAPLLLEYPDIRIEFDVNYGFRDIVADRFDAGVRLGDTIDKDMIAFPIGFDLRMAAVASPSYFTKHSAPKTPQDLGIVFLPEEEFSPHIENGRLI